jgi:5-methylcytosine-specific restriction protein A
MPTAALRPCSKPGCRALVSGGLCPAHQKAKYRQQDDRRESSSKRGYDATWYNWLRWFRTCGDVDADDPNFTAELQRRNRCAECWRQGRDNRQRLEFDHIVPLRQGGERLSAENVQPLCYQCHARKRSLESRGVVNEGRT